MELTEKFNELVHNNPYASPDIWFDQWVYYKQLILRTGSAEKTDVEIVTHVIATEPKLYNKDTTLLQG
jgi:hypothetical protein